MSDFKALAALYEHQRLRNAHFAPPAQKPVAKSKISNYFAAKLARRAMAKLQSRTTTFFVMNCCLLRVPLARETILQALQSRASQSTTKPAVLSEILQLAAKLRDQDNNGKAADAALGAMVQECERDLQSHPLKTKKDTEQQLVRRTYKLMGKRCGVKRC